MVDAAKTEFAFRSRSTTPCVLGLATITWSESDFLAMKSSRAGIGSMMQFILGFSLRVPDLIFFQSRKVESSRTPSSRKLAKRSILTPGKADTSACRRHFQTRWDRLVAAYR